MREWCSGQGEWESDVVYSGVELELGSDIL